MPAILTCFAYRNEYILEMEGMLPTIRKHHPNWPIVVGRGPVAGFDMPTLALESPFGKRHWSLPVPLKLDGRREASETDWAKITLMKAWWIAQVWHNFSTLLDSDRNRIVWLDADGRLNGPLDFELDLEAEVIGGPWWTDPGTPEEHHQLCSGLLIFQGARNGIVEATIDQWSAICVSYIHELPPIRPNRTWRDNDQEVLTGLLKSAASSNSGPGLVSLKLNYDKYCGVPESDGTPKPGALVDQWMMNEKMRMPEDRDRNWPPPEEARRQTAEPGPCRGRSPSTCREENNG
jgi:hypothetical protein